MVKDLFDLELKEETIVNYLILFHEKKVLRLNSIEELDDSIANKSPLLVIYHNSKSLTEG